MPAVTGSLHDIIGSRMTGKEAVILFELNGPNIRSGGDIHPTETVRVTPSELDGSFTVNLMQTTSMMTDAWYKIRIRWLGTEAGSALIDFPDWKIRVPSGGGRLDQMFSADEPGFNRRMVWVSLTSPPTNLPAFSLWLHSDPDDPDNTNYQSSGKLYELRNA